ncbi:MAG: YggS family pyridoxal phosphate-dependent enzyme [Selenomonadaceae bacterium]|nr:YggS family pyridoxal phosphate-dependent enzyme [Selenomonadaceae bacterium]
MSEVKNLSITENLKNVLSEIEKSAPKNEKIILVAVTKNHGVEEMREAIDCGILNVGENRIQEATEKFQLLDRKVTRHLIGHLQTNKAKQAVKLFDLIQSVDSEHLAEAIDKAANSANKIQDILIQVNLAKEDSKSGVYEEDLQNLIETVDTLKNLRLCGLMMIAPNYSDVEKCRPLFRRMREIFDNIRVNRQDFDFLSMGMTHDYKIAVEEGANVVRIGTAIFGVRDYSKF